MYTSRTNQWPLALMGPSTVTDRARAAFDAAASSAAPALIVADGGLDADAIARAIHERSRPGTPFIVIDCAAADAKTSSGELFGMPARAAAHRADLETLGAARRCCARRAGTLYLKHILDLPAATQRRLARILRDREVSAAGPARRSAAASSADAPASVAVEVGEGHFRSDLFRRLSQVCIAVPRCASGPRTSRRWS